MLERACCLEHVALHLPQRPRLVLLFGHRRLQPSRWHHEFLPLRRRSLASSDGRFRAPLQLTNDLQPVNVGVLLIERPVVLGPGLLRIGRAALAKLLLHSQDEGLLPSAVFLGRINGLVQLRGHRAEIRMVELAHVLLRRV